MRIVDLMVNPIRMVKTNTSFQYNINWSVYVGTIENPLLFACCSYRLGLSFSMRSFPNKWKKDIANLMLLCPNETRNFNMRHWSNFINSFIFISSLSKQFLFNTINIFMPSYFPILKKVVKLNFRNSLQKSPMYFVVSRWRPRSSLLSLANNQKS